jgi:hypothetical protein
VAVAAIIHEGRLQRRLDPGHLGKVDVALDLPLGGALEIEVDEMVFIEHDHPGLFGVGRVDQHALGHGAETPVARSATSLRATRAGELLHSAPLARPLCVPVRKAAGSARQRRDR